MLIECHHWNPQCLRRGVVSHVSICTGEEVAGFKDIRTGKIEEIMLIRLQEDLEKFKEIYEITEKIAKDY